ncbi:hypothetical protein [Haladaptatus salinisoli]|uniref:hypothetical protein n=1 Tax=Haladaptatus salinisoli TaxID=2884876 RepID=UPI001D0B9B57|nr:hypothetical protein [Haladaptatus salinisoli]
MLYYVDRDLEDAAKGETELSLVTVSYEGEHSALPTKGALQDQGYLRVLTPLVSGQQYPTLVRDEGLGYLESNQEVAVSYRPEDVARTWLNSNYLPPAVFGQSADKRVQDLVFDALDIEWRGMNNEGGNREELYAVLGEEMPDSEYEDDPHPSRVQELLDYTRSQLQAVAPQFDKSADDVATAGKQELAYHLAEYNRSRVLSELESETDAETADTEGVA